MIWADKIKDQILLMIKANNCGVAPLKEKIKNKSMLQGNGAYMCCGCDQVKAEVYNKLLCTRVKLYFVALASMWEQFVKNLII